MHKTILSILLLFLAVQARAQTTINGSFVHGGITRTYSFYVPASYTPGQAVPLVIGLHGLSSSGANFAQYRNFRPIADTANFIMAHPDGSLLFGVRYWNYGITGSSPNDVGFIEALIDTISAHYTIDHNRVYSVGMSNGSFMSYYLACQSDRFAAVGGVTGSMSTSMYNSCVPAHPTPAIHVHGTEDPTNPYDGTTSMTAIEDLVQFWVDQNNCSPTPQITSVPNTNTSDGATAEHYVYSGGTNGHTVEFFKVIGGEHTWPGCPMPGSTDVTCMDFDARVEIWRFFSRYERSGSSSLETHSKGDWLKMYPNPAQGSLNLDAGERSVNTVVIMDMKGRVVKKLSGQAIQQVDISMLKPGQYTAAMSGKDFHVVKKLTVL
ncbi:MAG: T9SS type A sorting domain-containing protein [Flavobacteriales bacterium]